MNENTLFAILNEKDVENFYRQHLTKRFRDIVFNSPLNCDGYGESEKHGIKIICEFKDKEDFSLKINQVKVLSQVVYYIKKFELAGKILPSIIFVGDRDECFTIHTNIIIKYLEMRFDWSIAPSSAHTNLDLVNLMMNDSDINPFIFDIKDVDNCIEKMKQLSEGVRRLIPITPNNITEIFKNFEEKVLAKNNLTTNQIANLFIQILINPLDNFCHPKKKNTLITKSFGDIPLKSTQSFESFFSHFESEYSPKQKEQLTAVVDRLVQDVIRRKQGEFYTPTLWANKAHEYISSVFGDEWKDKYVVWDPAWGTGNLTRDFKFKELYVSTLNQDDIETANQMGYNPEAIKFKYDFLNDPYEYLPQGLRLAIENNKDIIVLINSPFGRANGDSKVGTIMKGGTTTFISDMMKNENYGNSSSQLYAQFLYRLLKLNIQNICVFSKSLYKTSTSYKPFREKFYNKYKFISGFLFKGSEFSDVSNSWAVDFSIFSKGVQSGDTEMDVFVNENNEIKKIGTKRLVSTDNKNILSDWVNTEKTPVIDFPKLSSALVIKETKYGFGKPENAFATLVSNANNVAKNANSVYIVNGGVVENVGKIFISNSTFIKSCCIFSARKLMKGDWINDKDEYFMPNEQNEFFSKYYHDSIIFSLYNNSSEQSSLRQITYKEKLWDIKNQFFWISKEEMMNLANQNNYTELYNDARTDSDRYVYNLLFGEQRIYDQLSDEAKDVLDTATNLVRMSIEMRRNFADDTNHLNSWDAGYAQLKLLWKEYFPEQFKQFREKYKVLEDKMRPMVYELGFLLK